MKYLARELYYFLIKVYKKVCYKNVKVGFRSKIAKKASFEGYNKVEHHSYFSGEMGKGSYIGEYTNFIGKIGRYCSVGAKVNVLALTHPVRKFVSTSPCFYSTKKQAGLSYVDTQKFNEFLCVQGTEYPVVLGNDVYIGYGVTIIAPVVIGDGAVVAAGAIVTKDVEPYTIVAGNPAKEVGKRFADIEINKLQQIQWWNRDEKWIRERIDKFDNIQDFISSC